MDFCELEKQVMPYLENDDGAGLAKAFEDGSLEKDSELLYLAISSKAWNCLMGMWDAGIEEEFSDYYYKDYPLIFDLIFSGQYVVACEWIDRDYNPEAFGGRQMLSIAHAAARKRSAESYLRHAGYFRKEVEEESRKTPHSYSNPIHSPRNLVTCSGFWIMPLERMEM